MILITGICGFIGINLLQRLIKEGFARDSEIIGIDNLSLGRIEYLRDFDIRFYPFDCRQVREIRDSCSLIFHLGIPSSSPMYRENPYLYGVTLNDAVAIFEFARRCRARVIYASTSSIYSGNPTPWREDMPIHPMDYYTECRYAIERLARLYYNLYRVESIGLRFFSVYGPYEEHKGKYANVVSQFLWSIMREERPVIYGDGEQSRDFIHVSDVAKALMLAAETDWGCEVLNIGTGKDYTFNQVVNLINDLLGTHISPKYVDNPIPNYIHKTLADRSRRLSDDK